MLSEKQPVQQQILILMRTEFSRLQAKNSSYSLRAFARRLALAPSATSEILSGQREVSGKMAKRILTGLVVDPAVSAKILQRLGATASSKRKAAPSAYSQIAMDHYHVISDWYYFAILSLAETESFVSSPSWIGGRLNISESKAKQALIRLDRLGLLTREGKTLKCTGKRFETSSDIADASLKKSHSQTLELASEALFKDDVEARDISSITMAIDPDLLPEAKVMIREFRRKLSDFLESGTKREVYRFSAQLFSLTKSATSKGRQLEK